MGREFIAASIWHFSGLCGGPAALKQAARSWWDEMLRSWFLIREKQVEVGSNSIAASPFAKSLASRQVELEGLQRDEGLRLKGKASTVFAFIPEHVKHF